MKREDMERRLRATHFQVDPATHKRLRHAAIEEGISMGEAIRRAIDGWLTELEKKWARKRPKEE
jgi:hypothetical protein